MTEEIPKLDRDGLRRFGLVMGAVIAGIFGILLPLIFRHMTPSWPWWLAAIFIIWASVVPQTLDPVYHLWMRFGMVVNWIETRVVLGILFYGLLVPMGTIMRNIFGKDPMKRDRDRRAETYRTTSSDRPLKSMERPF
jgi:Saxitoxin biosynthesis operon protein SxtJ